MALMSLTLCVQLWAVPGNEDLLVAYEDEVLELLADHGARLLQRVRRVDQGDLSDEQVEALGLGLSRLEEAMDDLKSRYDLTTEDLNIDLGPLGTLLSDTF